MARYWVRSWILINDGLDYPNIPTITEVQLDSDEEIRNAGPAGTIEEIRILQIEPPGVEVLDDGA